MKPQVFVTLDAPDREELVSDDVSWSPAIATVVLRHASGEVGFQIDDADRGAAIATFLGDCMLIERCNSPRWRNAAGSALSTSDARYYAGGFFGCTHPQQRLIETLELADRNQKIAQQNVLLVRHGRPPLSLTCTVFDDWHDDMGRVRTSALLFLMNHCAATSLWRHSEFGTYARFFSREGSSALQLVSDVCRSASLPMKIVQQHKELPAW
jgi:hypothetical protein